MEVTESAHEGKDKRHNMEKCEHYCAGDGKCNCMCHCDHGYRKWLDINLWVALVSLIVVLLPGIMLKFMNLKSNPAPLTADSLVVSPSFNSATLLIGFILALYAMAFGRKGSTRTLALLTIIVCLVRFLLPS